jgi:hypothetical protein
MSATFRSDGWSVRPSFVPHGATSPVTLLGDESGLTQLAGDPAVAWQTPWSELSSLQLVRFSRGLALFATVDGVRYCWRTLKKSDYESVSAVITEHGGRVVKRRRRAGLVAVVVVVLVASLAGGIGAYFSKTSTSNQELANTKSVNLTIRDFSKGWSSTDVEELSYLFTTPGKVYTSTTVTTQPAANSEFAKIGAVFQKCLGVSAEKDRMYGAAGQQPDYQVSSKIFLSANDGGIEVASTTQYYATTTMVKKDTAEMKDTNFGSCFVASNAAQLEAGSSTKVPTVAPGTNFRPHTFVKGFSRGGVETVALGGASSTFHLVMVIMTARHYETTLGVLVSKWPKSETLVTNLVNVLLARMTSSDTTNA